MGAKQAAVIKTVPISAKTAPFIRKTQGAAILISMNGTKQEQPRWLPVPGVCTGLAVSGGAGSHNGGK